MTSLLDRPPATFDVRPAPAPAGAAAACQAAGASLLAVLAPVVLAWVVDSDGKGTWLQAVRLSLAVWLLAQHGGLTVDGGHVGIVPLGLTLAPLAACWLGGRRMSRALDPRAEAIAAGATRAAPRVAPGGRARVVRRDVLPGGRRGGARRRDAGRAPHRAAGRDGRGGRLLRLRHARRRRLPPRRVHPRDCSGRCGPCRCPSSAGPVPPSPRSPRRWRRAAVVVAGLLVLGRDARPRAAPRARPGRRGRCGPHPRAGAAAAEPRPLGRRRADRHRGARSARGRRSRRRPVRSGRCPRCRCSARCPPPDRCRARRWPCSPCPCSPASSPASCSSRTKRAARPSRWTGWHRCSRTSPASAPRRA